MAQDPELIDELRRVGEYPLGFREWPRESQVTHIVGQMNRVGLVERILALSRLEPDREIDPDRARLNKRELAAIYLRLQECKSHESQVS